MRVLVTGATGFLGLHCIEALLAAGHEVRLLVRSEAKMQRIYGPRGIEIDDFVVGDMADAEAVGRALDGVDGVLHAAAGFYGDERVLAANVAGVQNVVGGAAERGIDPILYVSTIGCMFPPPGDVMTADDPIASFETTYGRSKAAGEVLVRELQERGAAITTIYPSGVLGPDDPGPGEGTKGLRDTVSAVVPVTSGGIAIVDVRDVAQIATACMIPGTGPRRYMTAGHFVTWSEYADVCDAVTGRKVRRVRVPPSALLLLGRALDLVRKVVPFEYPLTHEAAQFMIHLKPCDSSPVCNDLDFDFRPTDVTLADGIRWLHRAGHIEAKHAGKLADPG
jgi:nucleoside-diphosphate-sugar epimerase